MLGLTQALVSIVLYGGIAIIFWYGPYLIRTECQNYSAGQWIVVGFVKDDHLRLREQISSFRFSSPA